MHTDPISDFTTRIRNAARAGKEQCEAPHSKLKLAIAKVLLTEGFIKAINEGKDANGHKTIVIELKYVDGDSSINGIDRVSKPGLRLYAKSTEIPRVLNGLGVCILSTPQGVMKDRDARRKKVGGELICNVW